MGNPQYSESVGVERQTKFTVWGRTVSFMMALTLLGQLLAFARETTIAAKFGASGLTDAFFLAIVLPNALLLVVQNGLMMAFVPVLANTLATKGEKEAWLMSSNVINISLLFTFLFGGLLVFGAGPIVSLLAPTFPLELQMLSVRMLRLLAPVGMLGGLVAVLTGILNVYRVYVVPTLFGFVVNVSMVGGTLLLADRLSAYALVAATLSGYFFQLLILLWPLLKVQKYSFVIDFKDYTTRKIARLAWPAITILLLQQVVVVADRTIASRLGIGNVASLSFAARLILPAAALLIGPVSTITLPELSRIVAANDKKRTKQLSTKILRYTLFLTLPVAINLFVLSKPIVSLLLEHGAFTSASAEVTSSIMAAYTLTLLGVAFREVIVRILFAHQESRIPLYSGFVRMIVNLALNVILAQLIGIRGIALANGIAIIFDVIIMIVVLIRWDLLTLQLNFLVKMLGAALVTMFVAHSINVLIQTQWLTKVAISNLIVTILLVGVGSVFAYIVSGNLFSIAESQLLVFTGMNFLKSNFQKLKKE